MNIRARYLVEIGRRTIANHREPSRISANRRESKDGRNGTFLPRVESLSEMAPLSLTNAPVEPPVSVRRASWKALLIGGAPHESLALALPFKETPS